MDPKLILYLKNIVTSLTCGLVWMAVAVYWGVHKNYAFYENKVAWQNIVFYVFFVVSLSALLLYMFKIWRKPLNIEL